MSFMITAWSRWQQLRNPNVSWLALVGGGRQHHKTTRWETVSSLSVCKWGSGSHMAGSRTAGTIWNHAPFERDVTAPRWRRMKPAREAVPLVKPPHFSPAIWSLREAVGNGWVIPKEHKPSSQTYFSNALHFTVQVGTPEKKTFLGSCSSIPGTWQRDTQWCSRCSSIPEANRQCEIFGEMQQMQGQGKIFLVTKINPNLCNMHVNNSIVYYYQL